MKTEQPALRKPEPWQIAMAVLPTGATVPSFQLLACKDLAQIASLFGYDCQEVGGIIDLSHAYGMAAIEADFAILKMLTGKL